MVECRGECTHTTEALLYAFIQIQAQECCVSCMYTANYSTYTFQSDSAYLNRTGTIGNGLDIANKINEICSAKGEGMQVLVLCLENLCSV